MCGYIHHHLTVNPNVKDLSDNVSNACCHIYEIVGLKCRGVSCRWSHSHTTPEPLFSVVGPHIHHSNSYNFSECFSCPVKQGPNPVSLPSLDSERQQACSCPFLGGCGAGWRVGGGKEANSSPPTLTQDRPVVGP